VFWALNREIPRLRADEALALMPATSAAGMGANVGKIVEQLRREIGQPVLTEVRRAARASLRRLATLADRKG
jgi:hypothetical protein